MTSATTRVWVTPMAYLPLLDEPFQPKTQLPLPPEALATAAHQLARAVNARADLIGQAERLTPERFRPASSPPAPRRGRNSPLRLAP